MDLRKVEDPLDLSAPAINKQPLNVKCRPASVRRATPAASPIKEEPLAPKYGTAYETFVMPNPSLSIKEEPEVADCRPTCRPCPQVPLPYMGYPEHPFPQETAFKLFRDAANRFLPAFRPSPLVSYTYGPYPAPIHDLTETYSPPPNAVSPNCSVSTDRSNDTFSTNEFSSPDASYLPARVFGPRKIGLFGSPANEAELDVHTVNESEPGAVAVNEAQRTAAPANKGFAGRDGIMDDIEYRRKRARNNLAAKRSRDNKRIREEQKSIELMHALEAISFLKKVILLDIKNLPADVKADLGDIDKPFVFTPSLKKYSCTLDRKRAEYQFNRLPTKSDDGLAAKSRIYSASPDDPPAAHGMWTYPTSQ